jgi:hypothetical protein
VSFAASKKLKTTIVGDFDDDSVNVQIATLIQAYGQTVTLSTIKGHLKKAGMDLDVMTRPFKIWIVKQALRENSNLKEIRERHILLADLSRYRCIPRFGILNSEFCPA